MEHVDATEVLIDGIGRPQEALHAAIKGLSADQLNLRPDGPHNSISWLAWHAARQQDVQIAHLAHTDEVWTSAGWADKFGLDLPTESMGYGHTSADVAKVQVSDPNLLTGYLDAATEATIAYLRGLSASDLDDVIDRDWDPPVTRGARLVSIVDDSAQHAGQAAYVRGLIGK